MHTIKPIYFLAVFLFVSTLNAEDVDLKIFSGKRAELELREKRLFETMAKKTFQGTNYEPTKSIAGYVTCAKSAYISGEDAGWPPNCSLSKIKPPYFSCDGNPVEKTNVAPVEGMSLEMSANESKALYKNMLNAKFQQTKIQSNYTTGFLVCQQTAGHNGVERSKPWCYVTIEKPYFFDCNGVNGDESVSELLPDGDATPTESPSPSPSATPHKRKK